MKKIIKRTLVASALSLLLISTSYADLDSSVSDFFNGVSFGENSSSLSLVIKTKSDYLQLLSIELPTLKAGNNGIDLFLGGWTFVNAQRLVELGNQVINNIGWVNCFVYEYTEVQLNV